MACGGGRVAPLGPPLVSFVLLLALLAASCLAKAPPEAKKKPPGSILGAILAPTASFLMICWALRGESFSSRSPSYFYSTIALKIIANACCAPEAQSTEIL